MLSGCVAVPFLLCCELCWLAGSVAVLGWGAAVRRAGWLVVLLGFVVLPRAVLSWMDVFLWFVLVLGWLAVVPCFAAVLQAVPGRPCNAQTDDEKMLTRWL